MDYLLVLLLRGYYNIGLLNSFLDKSYYTLQTLN